MEYWAAINLGSASSVVYFIVDGSQAPFLSPQSAGIHSLKTKGCGL